jgi:hypothetical protein
MRHHLLTTADAEAWRAVLPAQANVMASVEFARLLEQHTGCPARLFVAEIGGGALAYPYLLRSLGTLPFPPGVAGVRWDTFTPEYTGPVAVRAGPLRAEDGRAFVEAFAASCREQGIVAEFAHLNPWHAPEAALEPAAVEVNRDVVFIDLTWGEERIWNESFTSDARRATRRSWDAGVTVRRASSPADIREFHRLYELTMERRDALDRYRFPVEHFLALHETLPRNAFFVLAEHGGRAVAGGLFLESGDDVYWHLSAADLEQSRLRPVNAYLHDTVRWAVRAGKQRMLLGGAYRAGDGVYRFKAGFSPLRVPFRTYQRVHDPETYRASTSAWSVHHGGREPPRDYFPAYRAA